MFSFSWVVAHAQRVVHFGRAVVFRHGAQYLNRVRHVARVAVQPRQVQHYIFGVGIDVLRRLELLLRFRRIVGQRVELPEKQPALDIVALQLHDLGVFADRELQNLLGRPAILNVAQ